MRTKTLLLAAAALAAGIVTSEAQSNVYSQNIVGYAQVILPAGQYAAVCNPFNLDGTNNSTNVLASLPNGSVLQYWTGSGFDTATKASFGPNAGQWNTNFVLAPGTGFFINCSSLFTNTFIGNVVVAAGATNTDNLASGANVFIGSPVPYSGNLTDSATIYGLNLGASLPNGSVVQFWNGSGYNTATKASFGPNAGNFNTNFVISIGQGLFVTPGGATSWSQSVTN